MNVAPSNEKSNELIGLSRTEPEWLDITPDETI